MSLTSRAAESIRMPSAPRSNQNRSTSWNSSTTSGLSQLKSGCSGANRCRYHSPSAIRVHAGPPKIDVQSLGGSSPFSPRPGRKWKRSRSAEPGSASSACRNHFCWWEPWLGTMSMIVLMPRACASAMNSSASASVPNDGSMSR